MIKARKLFVFAFIITLINVVSTAESNEVELDDMILTKQQYEEDFTGKGFGRNGILTTRTKIYRWPKNTVPIGWDIFLNTGGRRKVKAAAKIISDASCIKFEYNFTPQKYPNYIFVRNNSINQCKSHVGFQNIGRQIMEWSPQCNFVHTLLHVLGFYHMHQTPTRDQFVKINLNSAEPRFRKNFYKLHPKRASLFDTPYDYYSIMHYPQYVFSQKPGEWKTIIPLKGDKNTPNVMGQQFAWSAGDIKRLNNMYRCPPKKG